MSTPPTTDADVNCHQVMLSSPSRFIVMEGCSDCIRLLPSYRRKRRRRHCRHGNDTLLTSNAVRHELRPLLNEHTNVLHENEKNVSAPVAGVNCTDVTTSTCKVRRRSDALNHYSDECRPDVTSLSRDPRRFWSPLCQLRQETRQETLASSMFDLRLAAEYTDIRLKSSASVALDVDEVASRKDSTTAVVRHCTRERCCHCFRRFVTFLFSTVGSCCLMVGYVMLGGLVFRQLEVEHERSVDVDMQRVRDHHVGWLWNLTTAMNVLHPDNWTSTALHVLDSYTRQVISATKNDGWDGDDAERQSERWSFTGAMLYSITVITTIVGTKILLVRVKLLDAFTIIGYGHITPRTDGGRLATMFYAIFGIPLTLYTLTNLGSIMATAFRFLYKYICCGLCCLCCSRMTTITTAAEDGATTTTTDGIGRGSVWLLRGRRRHHVDVTPVDQVLAGDDEMTGWRQRFAAAVAETVDINQVSVPIYVSVLLMTGYILLGASLFALSEGWDTLVAAYFCFITLSTIGFGDYVPGTSLDPWRSQKMVACALYLVFGMALMAMCFNLMQEEATNKFRRLGRRLGLVNDPVT